MTAAQANAWLARAGFPALFVHKAEGVWYLCGDEGVVNQSVERCLHVVRLADLDAETLQWKLRELTAA